ncbi:50S ribosomal protein L2, chloroplastic [Apostasia shenzhenica]|uniref:50S ribosomal protein L2, chloroplastic n=1 Tax=Apostasia shenzhenica TaxID=1088818 RepID=A0A2H9ZTT7_9ASPA|nr:50S ribosomal protein L2, chloroplastic [Apostasia shenzhenica]
MNPMNHPHRGGKGRAPIGKKTTIPWGYPAPERRSRKKKTNIVIVLFFIVVNRKTEKSNLGKWINTIIWKDFSSFFK